MEWIQENWFWLVVGGLFIWMHRKMHGGHGGHGGCGDHGSTESSAASGDSSEENFHAQH